MEEPPAPRPTLKQRALADKSAREAREAAALRANLLRRKNQARSRAMPLDQRRSTNSADGEAQS